MSLESSICGCCLAFWAWSPLAKDNGAGYTAELLFVCASWVSAVAGYLPLSLVQVLVDLLGAGASAA